MVSIMTNIMYEKFDYYKKYKSNQFCFLWYAYGYGGFFINPILDVVF